MCKILSVIVPSFNMEKYLNKGLTSLIVKDTQLLDLLEVIVVNDGSNDKTLEIAHEFEARYPGVIRVIDKNNAHYGSCINAGLKVCTGQFVKILDADDYYITDNLEKLIYELSISEKKNEEVDLFFCNYRSVDENDELLKNYCFEIPENQVTVVTDEIPLSYFKDIQHHAILWRTTLLLEHNYKQTERVPYSDAEWFSKPLLYIKKIKYVPIPVYSYLVGRKDQSMNAAQVKKGLESLLIIEKSLLNTYWQIKGQCASANERIYREKVFHNIRYLYNTYLLNYYDKECGIAIRKFDSELKDKAADIYEELGETYFTIKKLNFKFIQAFRTNCFRFRVMVSLYKFKKAIHK